MNIAKPYPKIKQGLYFVNDVSHFLSQDSGRLTGLEYLQRITDKTSSASDQNKIQAMETILQIMKHNSEFRKYLLASLTKGEGLICSQGEELLRCLESSSLTIAQKCQ